MTFNLNTFRRLKSRKDASEYIKRLDIVGYGSARIVYDLKDGRVIKMVDPAEHIFVGGCLEQNRNEWRISKCTDKVAKCLEKHPKYWWVISEYCTPVVINNWPRFYKEVTKYKKTCLLYDLNYDEICCESHFGVNKEGKLLIIDYGATNNLLDRWYWHV